MFATDSLVRLLPKKDPLDAGCTFIFLAIRDCMREIVPAAGEGVGETFECSTSVRMEHGTNEQSGTFLHYDSYTVRTAVRTYCQFILRSEMGIGLSRRLTCSRRQGTVEFICQHGLHVTTTPNDCDIKPSNAERDFGRKCTNGGA